MSGPDTLSSGMDVLRLTAVARAEVAEQQRLALAYLQRCGAEDLAEMLGLDEASASQPDLPACAWAPCGRSFLPRSRQQKFCGPVCRLRAVTVPAQERVLTPFPTGACPDCADDRVPLTPTGRIGQHRELQILVTRFGRRPYRTDQPCPGFTAAPVGRRTPTHAIPKENPE